MARAESFTANVMEAIAAQVQNGLGGLSSSLAPGIGLEIREVFKVYAISLDEIQDPSGKPLAERATWNRQWHVQLFQGEQPVGYVLLGGEDTPAELQAIFLSSLAQAIDEAIQRIDAQEVPEDRDPEVYLLVAPSHHLHTLWLQEPLQQVIALDTELKRDEPYGAQEILTRLREIPPIVGLS